MESLALFVAVLLAALLGLAVGGLLLAVLSRRRSRRWAIAALVTCTFQLVGATLVLSDAPRVPYLVLISPAALGTVLAIRRLRRP